MGDRPVLCISERKIRVLIVDDIEEIRSYFRMVLEKEKDIEVPGPFK